MRPPHAALILPPPGEVRAPRHLHTQGTVAPRLVRLAAGTHAQVSVGGVMSPTAKRTPRPTSTCHTPRGPIPGSWSTGPMCPGS